MDLLITLLVVIGILGLSGGCMYLLKKIDSYNPADIAYIQSLFNIGMDIVDELNLKQEPQIKIIAKIVSDSLNQVLLIAKDKDINNEDLEKNTFQLVEDACIGLRIIITPEREKIIQALIDAGLDAISSKPV